MTVTNIGSQLAVTNDGYSVIGVIIYQYMAHIPETYVHCKHSATGGRGQTALVKTLLGFQRGKNDGYKWRLQMTVTHDGYSVIGVLI